MRDAEYFDLMRWALPRMGLRWSAFRRVKRQVCKRIRARVHALELTDAQAYAQYLERHPDEWATLEAMCGITISRFYRDRPVFDVLAKDVLPRLTSQLEPGESLRVWSAGCASGEEPYSIALIWELEVSPRFPGRELQVIATERNRHLLARAAAACYRHSSLRELPAAWVASAFTNVADGWCLDPKLLSSVTFERQDLRRTMPSGPFHVILCRNLAFSYFELSEQHAVQRALVERLSSNGHLVIGLNETLPEAEQLEQLPQSPYIHRRLCTA
ncbi:MAG TPA: CheR family methyltransferase [Polyangiales bacterium]|nr:CheR family methyltransferase [Polyangiales bacterium]